MLEHKTQMFPVVLVLPNKYANRIYYISYLTITSIIISFYLGLYEFTFLTSSVLLTSLNYWKHPLKNWRRNIDMFMVCLTYLYTLTQCHHSNIYNRYVYYTCNGIGIICYTFARKNNCKDKSSLYHCGVHLISNIGNIVLYLGFDK